MAYERKDCRLITTGRAWAEDNSRQRGEPEDVGINAVCYLNTERRERSLVFVIGKRRLYWVKNGDLKQFDPLNSGDEHGLKICLSCGLLMPTEEFPRNQTGKGDRVVRRPRCKECFERDSGRKMSTKVRDAYLAEHGPARGDLWQCPLCLKYSIAGVNVRITVDHDQETGTPRGLICDSCNTGLGRFKNGEDHLQSAIEYLAATEGRRQEGS